MKTQIKRTQQVLHKSNFIASRYLRRYTQLKKSPSKTPANSIYETTIGWCFTKVHYKEAKNLVINKKVLKTITTISFISANGLYISPLNTPKIVVHTSHIVIFENQSAVTF